MTLVYMIYYEVHKSERALQLVDVSAAICVYIYIYVYVYIYIYIYIYVSLSLYIYIYIYIWWSSEVSYHTYYDMLYYVLVDYTVL